MNGNIAA
jgi:hypothetical protein